MRNFKHMQIRIPYKYKPIFAIIISLSLFGLPNVLLIIIQSLNLNLLAAIIEFNHYLSTCAIVLLPLLTIGIRPYKYFSILTAFIVLIPIVIYLIISYQKLPTVWMLYTLFETNIKEASEFIIANGWWVLALSILPILYYSVIRKLMHKTFKFSKGQRIKLSIICLSVLALNFPLSFINNGNAHFKRKPINRIIANTPIHTLKKTTKAYQLYKNDLNNFTLNSDTQLRVDISKTDTIRKVVILILGESSRYANWQINGYARNTSPHLSKSTNIVSYQDVISPSFNTSKALPIILTTANDTNLFSTPHHSIISIFNKANFSTYWISNQSNRGSILVSSLAEQADSSIFIHNKGLLDEALLPYLRDILQSDQNNIFMVLHTQGNHFPYYNRYSSNFEEFNPVIKRNGLKLMNLKNKEEAINSYDNSILYTDNFISNCIKIINQNNASSVLCFSSDHGENLFDDNDLGYGRGFSKLSKHLFHIPLFFWASEQYISANNNKWESLKSNRQKKGSTTNLLPTLCEMANLNVTHSDSTLSFTNFQFSPTERYFMDKTEFRNYDDYFMLSKAPGSYTE